jgi:spermidine/putrescine transport system ATP-binding protein
LDLVELPQMASRRIKQLSGGQQQRIAIARALVNEPAVLLLDEPLGSLDLKLRQQMQVELKKLQERIGTTFVYITHDQSEALTMSNRLGVMRGGKLEQVGTTEEVYEHPKTLFVANFIGDNNVLHGNVCAIEPATISIDCQGLVIQAARTMAAAMGQSIALSIRPLRIQVGEEASAVDNHFRGRIVEATYTGDIIDYRVELPGGNRVSVKVVTGGQTKHGVGDSVEVGWNREHAVLVLPE